MEQPNTSIRDWLVGELKNNAVVIFGENHTSHTDVEGINYSIRKMEPVVIAHELLYNDDVTGQAAIKDRLRYCRRGDLCDPNLNQDIYQLGYDLDVRLVGIDTHVGNGSKLQKMRLREEHMLVKIQALMEHYPDGRIAVVVGDTHLRGMTKAMGTESILQTLKGNKRVSIKRSPNAEV